MLRNKTFTIDDTDFEKVKEMAEAMGISQSEIARKAIQTYYDSNWQDWLVPEPKEEKPKERRIQNYGIQR